MESHSRPTDNEDAAVVQGAMDALLLAGALGREGFVAFERACERLDRGGEGFDLDPRVFPSLQPRAEAVRRGQRRDRIGDAIFYAVLGAFVAYVLLLTSGVLSRGAPDLADSVRSELLRRGELA